MRRMPPWVIINYKRRIKNEKRKAMMHAPHAFIGRGSMPLAANDGDLFIIKGNTF